MKKRKENSIGGGTDFLNQIRLDAALQSTSAAHHVILYASSYVLQSCDFPPPTRVVSATPHYTRHYHLSLCGVTLPSGIEMFAQIDFGATSEYLIPAVCGWSVSANMISATMT